MKRRGILWCFLICLLAMLGLWWARQSTATVPEDAGKLPEATNVAQAKVAKLVAVPGIEPPAAKAVATTSVRQPVAANSPNLNFDPQAELRTLIPEIARLVREGNALDEYLTYVNPKERTPEMTQQLREEKTQNDIDFAQDPSFRDIMSKENERRARNWEAMASQTPTMNEAGDEATYQLTDAMGNGNTQVFNITFTKIDGKWYEN